MKKTSKKILSVALALVLALALCAPALAAETAPDDGLATRGDLVKLLYSTYGAAFPAEKADVTFTDVSEADGTAEAAAWAAGLGIAKGYGDGRFGPDDLVTREQAATMLYRFAQTAGEGFKGMWMFLLDYPDAAEIADWANEAMHWVVMHDVITKRDSGKLEPRDYIGINEVPVWMRNLDDALNVKLENEGYTLAIPAGIASLLNTELPVDVPEGTLFTVAEQASIDAAKAKGYDDQGMGWLFAIQKISEDEAHKQLCSDMSGRDIFARDAEGNYFLFCTPTDVRFDRETTEQMQADSEVWTTLNKWASDAKTRFVEDNGLERLHLGNSDFEIALYRVAYDPDVKYTLSTTAFGPLEPSEDVDAASYVLSALDGAAFEHVDLEEGPDGEYVVLNFPEEGVRYDVFSADGNLIRRVTEYGEDYMRAVYDEEGLELFGILQEWYFVLASVYDLEPVNE
jgi:hypothetical protein